MQGHQSPDSPVRSLRQVGGTVAFGDCVDGFDLLWADLTLLKFHSSPWNGTLTLWYYMVGVCRLVFFFHLIGTHLKRLPRVSAETSDSGAELGCLKGRVCTPKWKWDSRSQVECYDFVKSGCQVDKGCGCGCSSSCQLGRIQDQHGNPSLVAPVRLFRERANGRRTTLNMGDATHRLGFGRKEKEKATWRLSFSPCLLTTPPRVPAAMQWRSSLKWLCRLSLL